MYLKKNLTYQQKCELKEVMDFMKKQPDPTPENINKTLAKLMDGCRRSNTMWQDFKRRRPKHMESWFEDRGMKLYDWLTVRHVEKHILKALYDYYGVGKPFNIFSGYKAITHAKVPITKMQYSRNLTNIMRHGFCTIYIPLLDQGKKPAKQDRQIVVAPSSVRYLTFQKKALEKPYKMYKRTPLDHLQFFFRNPHKFEEKYGRKMDHREDEKLAKLIKEQNEK